MSLDVLAVCTGNTCRSPAIERLLAARTGLHVRSSGTHAEVGAHVSAPMAALLNDGGVATEGFAARQLEPEHIAASALILTCTRAHRATVLELEPTALDRTFTLLELVRLSRALSDARRARVLAAPHPTARLLELVAAAHEVRTTATLAPPAPGADDVIDPMGRPPGVYAEVYTQIRSAVSSISGLLD